MAILKIVDPPMHGGKNGRGAYTRLKRAIDYILDPKKTLGGLYTGSCNCISATSTEEMYRTQLQYGKEPKNEHDRVGYHFVISWKAEENVAPETALEIAKQFCEEYLPGYEAVYSVHTDQEHTHAHIVFNSVSYKTGYKYHYKNGDWAKIQMPLLNRLCREHGLHTLETDTGITLEEYEQERKKRNRNRYKGPKAALHGNHTYRNEKAEDFSFSDYVREDIDTLVMECSDLKEFECKMEERGYQIRYGNSEKYGKYMAVKNQEMKRFRRTYSLGNDYTLEMIGHRIAAFHNPIPEMRMETEERYLLTGPVYRCRFHYGTDNKYLRRQYARMHRLGIAGKHEKRPSYREMMQKTRELRRLEYQMKLITENGYRTVEEIDAGILAQEEVVLAVRRQMKIHKVQGKPYEQMLETYQRLEELEGAFFLYQEGDEIFRKEAEEFQKLKELTADFPCSKEELEEYMEIQMEKTGQLKRKRREEEKKLEAFRSLREEYDQVTKEYEPADDEMIKEMEEHASEESGMRKKRRKEL